MTKISLIVPCYNAVNFLAATIESVLKQEFFSWELVLVDDGSHDATWEIISRYIRLDSRITGFQKINGGTTKARNFGFSKSDPSSNYIFFLDHDDQLEPNALKELCTYLDLHPDVGLVGCQFQDVSADGHKLGTGKRNRWAPGIIFPHELRDDEFETPFATFFCATGQGPFALYRRSVYLQTDGWENAFWPHEDTDMFCQMALLGKVHFLPSRLYLKRIHPAQGMSDAARVQRSYAAFRMKWDNRQPKNSREAVLLKGAKKYYYSMHSPCRDLKVARKTLLGFFSHPNFGKLRWFVQLVASALHGFFINRFKDLTYRENNPTK
jgi:glycosyltransferase involved in cell wall biosynthesis